MRANARAESHSVFAWIESGSLDFDELVALRWGDAEIAEETPKAQAARLARDARRTERRNAKAKNG